MASPRRQEQIIDRLGQVLDASVRQCCRVLGFRRQTYHRRKQGHRPEQKDEALKGLLRQVAHRYVAWGFWMIFHFLRHQHNLPDNHKRVYRLWKEAGLNLRQPPKRNRIRREYQELLPPKQVNQGWAMDFVSDWVVGPEKKSVRVINIMDECSRRALWTEAHQSISAAKLIKILDQVVAYRGKPAYIRCDNGPEFIAGKLRAWANEHDIDLKHIQPGKPTQNGLIERLNKTLRIECLDLTWFTSLERLNEDLQDWTVTYNTLRPHRNLAFQPPESYEKLNEKLYYSVVAP